jgi:hypothetical protein
MPVVIGNTYRLADLVTMVHRVMRRRTVTVGMRGQRRDESGTHDHEGQETRTMGGAVACDARLHADFRWVV